MSEHAKEMREFLLQAKPIDLSKRPATLKLPQGHYGYVLSIFVLMFLAYKFFKDWNQGEISYEYLLLAGLNLFWGFSQLKQVLNQYLITIGADEVRFTKKRLFSTVESWKASLQQYQTLEFNFFAGEQKAPSLFSVDLIHPDPNKSLPLAASRQEVVARGWLEQFKIHLSLPVVDKAASRQGALRSEKKTRQSRLTMEAGVMLLLMAGVPAGLAGWYFWTLYTSPMKTVPCTVVAHEISEAEEPLPDGRDKLLTTHYRYTYQGQQYESGYKIGHYENEEKMQRWISKRPAGTQTNCFVDSRDPNRIYEYPISKSYLDVSVYMGIGLVALGLLWFMWSQFPLGFTRAPKTTFQKITQSSIKTRIKKRYRGTILQLKKLGFQGHCFYSEILAAFSLIPGCRIFIAMLWKREILTIRYPLRIATSYPLLALPEQGTFAMTHALETKFLTLFTDGTALVTGTEGRVPTFVDEAAKLHRQGTTQTVEAAWQQHQDRVLALKTEGKQAKSEARFEDYTEILTRTEKVYMDNNFFQSA